MRHLIRNLPWVGAGAVLAWIAIYVWGERAPLHPSSPVAAAADGPRVAPPPRSEPADADRAADPEPAAAVPGQAAEPAAAAPGQAAEIAAEAASDAAAGVAPPRSSGTNVVWFPPKELRAL